MRIFDIRQSSTLGGACVCAKSSRLAVPHEWSQACCEAVRCAARARCPCPECAALVRLDVCLVLSESVFAILAHVMKRCDDCGLRCGCETSNRMRKSDLLTNSLRSSSITTHTYACSSSGSQTRSGSQTSLCESFVFARGPSASLALLGSALRLARILLPQTGFFRAGPSQLLAPARASRPTQLAILRRGCMRSATNASST